jgi:hypothetical protein
MSPSKTLVLGKFNLISPALEGTISHATTTGMPAPHSIPASPIPPPEKIEADTLEAGLSITGTISLSYEINLNLGRVKVSVFNIAKS